MIQQGGRHEIEGSGRQQLKQRRLWEASKVSGSGKHKIAQGPMGRPVSYDVYTV